MTGDMLDQRWKPSPKAASSRVADETVLLHLESGTYFGLDPVGTRIWKGLEAGQSPRTICLSIAQAYDAPLDQIEEDARTFLEHLSANALLERG